MCIWNIVLILFVIFAILFFTCPIIYIKTGKFKHWYHDILKWHEPDESPKWSDGCSLHCKCKYCGKDIMQDSQGNWFEW